MRQHVARGGLCYEPFSGSGSQIALFPNLTATDEGWNNQPVHHLNDVVGRMFRLKGAVLNPKPPNFDAWKAAIVASSAAQRKPNAPVLVCVDSFDGGTVIPVAWQTGYVDAVEGFGGAVEVRRQRFAAFKVHTAEHGGVIPQLVAQSTNGLPAVRKVTEVVFESSQTRKRLRLFANLDLETRHAIADALFGIGNDSQDALAHNLKRFARRGILFGQVIVDFFRGHAKHSRLQQPRIATR